MNVSVKPKQDIKAVQDKQLHQYVILQDSTFLIVFQQMKVKESCRSK